MRTRNDLGLYEEHPERWWNPEDRFFRSLRSVGRFHLALLRDEWSGLLEGARVVDLGCGGGLVTLALCDLGAEVTGVERSLSAARAGQAEAARRGSRCSFVHADLRRCPMAASTFDLAVMTEVLEHLEEPSEGIREAGRLLRPGGRLFLNTFDRTWLSGLVVVGLAEGLGFVPRGTHDPALFLRPDELRRYAAESGMILERLVWERPALLRTVLTRTVHLVQARRGHGFSAFLVKGTA